ncbi:hypothetical protein [Gloeocapsa sp. PCC 73106]|uniref:hypothetical protein n=1 Tax=Gloeocapsa sp. PCC 73106 TaxID=102232 RepID=UPI0002ABED8C|nr:hypothetical protein [Gloeocapsa sp. PCC 73106]ELR96463.1 hypothetical protein GLO73106DRAFT_00002570 [Gloeocapsa sp. PCC 73106]
MEDTKTQMKEYVRLAAKLSKEAIAEFDNKNFAEGKRKMKLAREAAQSFQRLYQSQIASSI